MSTHSTLRMERSRPESPLHGWTAGIIKESLGNLSRGRTTAQPQKFYPITLRDIRGPILNDLVVPFLRKVGEHGMIWAGRSGVGKTPLSRAIAMAISEYHVHKSCRPEIVPHFRSGNNLDFFRGAVGTVHGLACFIDCLYQACCHARSSGHIITCSIGESWWLGQQARHSNGLAELREYT